MAPSKIRLVNKSEHGSPSKDTRTSGTCASDIGGPSVVAPATAHHDEQADDFEPLLHSQKPTGKVLPSYTCENPASAKSVSASAPVSLRRSSRNQSKMQIERKIRLLTEQHNIPKESPMPEFPMKQWSVKLYLLDQEGVEHPASCFNKVVYNLHPSFEEPQQTFHEPPFTCTNEGWGEFEMSIDMYTTEKAKITIFHDLNFQSPTYKVDQSITFKNPSQALIQALRETGPVGNDEDAKATKARKAADSKKRKFAYDYEKIGDALLKLGEDDLLHVIQMIHDHKSEDTVTNNDLDRGEFTVDLFTMPEPLTKMIWEFLVEQKFVTP